jgi:preprotein translocase subunit SecA
VCNFISENIHKIYELKVHFENPEAIAVMERLVILTAIDKLWQEHLYEMDSLRYSIGLRAQGQRDPLIEYKMEGFKMFDELMVNVKTEICHNVFRSASSMMAYENFRRNLPQQTRHDSPSAFEPPKQDPQDTSKASDIVSQAADDISKKKQQPKRNVPKVGRNEPCPCGSGKKYKNCCGA